MVKLLLLLLFLLFFLLLAFNNLLLPDSCIHLVFPKVTKDLSLGRHPLAGLDGAGSALTTLRKQFHSFLQTIANTMGKVREYWYGYDTG